MYEFLILLGTPCRKKQFPKGIVCVCTEDYCDTLEDVDPKSEDDIVLVSTSLVRHYAIKKFKE